MTSLIIKSRVTSYWVFIYQSQIFSVHWSASSQYLTLYTTLDKSLELVRYSFFPFLYFYSAESEINILISCLFFSLSSSHPEKPFHPVTYGTPFIRSSLGTLLSRDLREPFYPVIRTSKDVMQGKLFQKCTHLLYCSVLCLGGNVNIRRMLQPDMGSIFHIKKINEIF